MSFWGGEGAKLNLLEFRSPKGENVARKLRPYDQAIHHFAFIVEDIEAAYKELSARGVKFICPPQDTGIVRANAMLGPDGVVIELMQFVTS